MRISDWELDMLGNKFEDEKIREKEGITFEQYVKKYLRGVIEC